MKFTDKRESIGYAPGSLEPERVMIVRLTGNLNEASSAFEPVLPTQASSLRVKGVSCL